MERSLVAADIDAAVALSTAEGWNQTVADWRFMLDHGAGFAIDVNNELIATAIALPYASFGWISMVIVRADHRRRGYAARLLQRCLAMLTERRCVPMIDATPAGHDVYARLGFNDRWTLKRYRRTAPPGGVAFGIAAGAIRSARAGDMAAISVLDRAAFGAGREPLLRALLMQRPGLALIARNAEDLDGYLMCRPGRTALQIGPIVARTSDTAEGLVERVLGLTGNEPLVMDVPDRHARLGAMLIANGFVVERPLTRMAFGAAPAFGDVGTTFAIAGPELG